MADLLIDFLPECPTVSIDGCLLSFLTTLSSSGAESFKTGLQKALDDLNAEKSRLESVSLGLQNGIDAMNNKIAELQEELVPYDEAIQQIEQFLSDNVCPQLIPIRTILETLRAFIASQIGAINVAGLQGLLNEATGNIAILDCFLDLLQSLIDTIP